VARAAVLGGGSISPFGSGGADFGAFNIGSSSTAGGSTTVDPSDQAYIDYQQVKAQWDQGLTDNGTYEAAYAAYLAAYKAAHPDTAQAIGADATMASLQYSLNRDTLQAQVQTGQASLDDLLAFDQQALAGLNQNSEEFYTRLSTYWGTEQQVFSRDESAVIDAVNAGHMTYTQLADWYNQQGQKWADNKNLTDAIGDRITSTQANILQEQDQSVVDAWQNGTMDIKTFLAYASSAQTDPQSPRAVQWKANADKAVGQAQSASLGYRYGLTAEYVQLEAFVQGGAPKLGGTSKSTSTKTVMDASGKWVTVSSTSYTATAPTPAEQQAYADYQAKLKQAQTRMKEIQKQVSAMPGGWVTEDDMVAYYQAQQSTVQAGSPEWIADQQQIDSYRSKKAANELLAQSGVKISFPTYASETATDITVPGTEKPATAKAAAKVALAAKQKPYDDKIAAYTAEMNAPDTTPERKAQLAAAIKVNQTYKANLDKKPAALPKMTAPGAAPSSPASGASSGGGTAPTSGVAAATSAPTPSPATNATPSGFLRLIVGATNTGTRIGTSIDGRPIVSDVGAQTTYKTKNVGIPTGMTSTAFESFYNGFTGAIRDGQTEYNDPVTGASYLLPSDPTERLTMLSGLDQTNIALQTRQLQDKIAKGADDTTARAAFNKAVGNAKANVLYVMDYAEPGAPAGSLTTPAGTTKLGGAPDTSVNGPSVGSAAAEGSASLARGSTGAPVNVLAKGIELMSNVEQAVTMYGDAAKAAFASGDVAKAYAYLTAAGQLVGDPTYGSLDARLNTIADYAVVAQTEALGLGVAIPPEIQKDIDILASAAPQRDAQGHAINGESSWATNLFKSAGLEDLAAQFDPSNPQGVAAVNTATGAVELRKGVTLVYHAGTNGIGPGSLVPTYMADTAGFDASGKLSATQGNNVMVTMDVGGKPTPVLVPFTIGVVGHTSTGQALTGKLINVTLGGDHYTLGENPLSPGQWVPLSDGHPISVTLPPGVTVLQRPDSRLGSTEQAQFAFTVGATPGQPGTRGQAGTAASGGQGYIVAMDTTTGTYTLYAEDKATGQLTAVSNLAGDSGREGRAILAQAGISLDTAKMTGDQKLWAGSGIAFVGTGDQLNNLLTAITAPATAAAYQNYRTGERADLTGIVAPQPARTDLTGVMSGSDYAAALSAAVTRAAAPKYTPTVTSNGQDITHTPAVTKLPPPPPVYTPTPVNNGQDIKFTPQVTTAPKPAPKTTTAAAAPKYATVTTNKGQDITHAPVAVVTPLPAPKPVVKPVTSTTAKAAGKAIAV
jgi:hypothetical protein